MNMICEVLYCFCDSSLPLPSLSALSCGFVRIHGEYLRLRHRATSSQTASTPSPLGEAQEGQGGRNRDSDRLLHK